MIRIKIYYASQDAKRKHLYKEGQIVSLENPYLVTQYEGDFYSVDLDSTGTNYIQGNVVS